MAELPRKSMTTTSKKTNVDISHPLELVLSAYGPYAFGVTSLLIIWFTIVAPELKSRQLDYDKHAEIVSQQKAMAETMKMTAITMQSTANTMETTAQLLSDTVRKLEVQD